MNSKSVISCHAFKGYIITITFPTFDGYFGGRDAMHSPYGH